MFVFNLRIIELDYQYCTFNIGTSIHKSRATSSNVAAANNNDDTDENLINNDDTDASTDAEIGIAETEKQAKKTRSTKSLSVKNLFKFNEATGN